MHLDDLGAEQYVVVPIDQWLLPVLRSSVRNELGQLLVQEVARGDQLPVRVAAARGLCAGDVATEQVLEHVVVVGVECEPGLELPCSHVLLAEVVPLNLSGALIAAAREDVAHGRVEKGDRREALLAVDHLLTSRVRRRRNDGAEEVLLRAESHGLRDVVPELLYFVSAP